MIRLVLILTLVSLDLFAQTPVEKAKALYETKKYDEARALLNAVKDNSKEYASARYYLGRIAFDQKKYDDAVDFFDEAIGADDKVADYFNWLGDTYGTIAGDANVFKQGLLAPKMKSAWEKAIALDPKNMNARFSLIQFYTQAPGFMGGSADKAKEMARQITSISPAQGHRAMGNILNGEKKLVEAEKEYLEMVKADPAFTGSLANFYTSQKQFSKAFSLFEDAVKNNPADMTSIYQIGKTSALSGERTERGEECLKRYLQYTPKPNEPSHAGANMRLAQIYEKKGNKPEAKKLYEIAFKMDSKLKEAEEGLQRTSK